MLALARGDERERALFWLAGAQAVRLARAHLERMQAVHAGLGTRICALAPRREEGGELEPERRGEDHDEGE